jgi:hypothetical protein
MTSLQSAAQELVRVSEENKKAKEQTAEKRKRERLLKDAVLSTMLDSGTNEVDMGEYKFTLVDAKRTEALKPESMREILKPHTLFRDRTDAEIANFVDFVFEARKTTATKRLKRVKKTRRAAQQS